jgi:hypothetical protein
MGDYSSTILDVCCKWRWILSIKIRPYYPVENSPLYSLYRKLGWVSRCVEEKKKSRPFQESNRGRPLWEEHSVTGLIISFETFNHCRSGTKFLKSPVWPDRNLMNAYAVHSSILISKLVAFIVLSAYCIWLNCATVLEGASPSPCGNQQRLVRLQIQPVYACVYVHTVTAV